MTKIKDIIQYVLMLALLTAGSASLTGRTLPKEQAAHFCQLLIEDGNGPSPLRIHALRLATEENDSLTAEQLMTTFLFHRDNWQTLRIFPHTAADGTIHWYAPSDNLPATIGEEHQKYIREVLPRLQREIEAGQWKTVDAYIDKMIQYQCEFGGSTAKSGPSSGTLALVILGLTAILAATIFGARRKKGGHLA